LPRLKQMTKCRLCLVSITTITLLAAGCSSARTVDSDESKSASATAATNQTTECIESFGPEMDYFPDKAHLTHATNFSVEYHRSYKVVTVNHASDGGPGARYVLVQCGSPAPELSGTLSGATAVTVPITSLFSGSTTHLPVLLELNRLDVLTGINEAQYVSDSRVLDRMREGKIVEYGKFGPINAELIISKTPSMVMASGNTEPGYAPLRLAGIPLVANTEWLETSALGRAEWLKFIALFLNEEKRAEERFAEIVRRYRTVMERVKDIPENQRVKVMTGGVFRGSFIVAGGGSYVSGLIRDAGGQYVWADNPETGSPRVDMESQLARAVNADVWINGTEDWTSLEGMLADDTRYEAFKAFRTGQVWLYNRRLGGETGANDYWSRGVAEPDRILADLIKIFYPDRARDYEFEWYKQVPAN